MSYLAVLKSFFQKNPKSGSTSGSLPKFNQFFFVQRCISGKKFYEDTINSFYMKLLTDRETDGRTDRQTDRRRVKRNFLAEVTTFHFVCVNTPRI